VPPVAAREAIVNAVVHADYAQKGAPIRLAIFDDRVEIENPGLLPFGLTVDDLPHGISKLRNRVIGRVFHALGLVEQWGSGIQRMTAACRDAGLAAPVLEEIGTRLRVTVPLGRVSPPTVDETDKAILRVLRDGRGHLTSEVANAIRLTPRATRTRLRLVGRGLFARSGPALRTRSAGTSCRAEDRGNRSRHSAMSGVRTTCRPAFMRLELAASPRATGGWPSKPSGV
jgi:hypothetical protein